MTLIPKELSAFYKYASKATSNEDIHKLLPFLKQNLKSAEFDDIRISKKLFGSEPLNKLKLNKLFSQLNKIFDEFVYEAWEKQDLAKKNIEKELAIFKFYCLNDLDKEVRFTYSRIVKLLDALPHRDSFYYWSYFRLHSERPSMLVLNPEKNAENRDKQSNAIDKFYFLNKLLLEANRLNHLEIFDKKSEDLEQQDIINTIIELVGNNAEYADDLVLKIWSDVVQYKRNPKSELLFEKLEQNLFDNFSVLEPRAAGDLFTMLLNGYLLLEKDKFKVSQKSLGYYLFQIENDIIFDQGYFVSFNFENIISTGLKVKSPEWVLQFIDDYGHRLHPAGRKGSILFGRAKCYFTQGDLSKSLEVLERLRNVRFKNVFINIYVRILRIKAYYEIEVGQEMFDRHQPDRDIAAFKKFVANHSSDFSRVYQSRFKNFTAVVSRMLVCNSKKKAEAIRDDINTKYSPLEDRIWLEKQVQLLLKQ